ncbi:MAG: DISARM system helicase DrmA [Myxococcota bacterium]
MSSSLEIRNDLAAVLARDLVGPSPGSPLEREALDTAPSRFYLTGFLVPHQADEEWKTAGDGNDETDAVPESQKAQEETASDKASARKVFFPSSLGLSVCVGPATKELVVTAAWGDYLPAEEKKEDSHWQREPRLVERTVPLKSAQYALGHGGVRLDVIVRRLHLGAELAREAGLEGASAVSLFLVNDRAPDTARQRDQFFLFQAKLAVRAAEGFLPRPDLRGFHATEADEAIADLQYRDDGEWAVGHGVGTHAFVSGQHCYEVHTAWLPSAEVEKVAPASVAGDFDMQRLGDASTPDVLLEKLKPLTAAYAAWLDTQRPSVSPRRKEVADQLLREARVACRRIDDGLELLREPRAFRAFTVANQAMAMQALQREAQKGNANAAPAWRPFQLAFVLMNLRGIVDPSHGDRELVDLLFFPTGGGKTEAYLGLAAFTLVYRRLTNPGLGGAGVSVLMRYTLRLLTLDQLQRASALVCALELLRRKSTKDLGEWPFEIGLWVGRAATPNRMGRKGEDDENTARKRTQAYQRDTQKPLPVPLENCPWCGAAFTASSFQLAPDEDHPLDLHIACANRSCAFGGKPLPIITVDEPLYRRLPCFLIATLDKFAALPWEGRTGALFGKVDRADDQGFYGPADEGFGTQRLPQQLPPPDLIIQDELHLISGPLGTIAGLYEAVIDQLASRSRDGRVLRPKIVASTATVRRADQQIRELFARGAAIFPPPGPDRHDSFFARTVPSTKKPARLYLGVAAPGRSLKVVLLRTYLCLLGAAQRHYLAEGGEQAGERNPADPYMTLLGYFNSLRDLGGTRRIIEDEVVSRADSLTRSRARHAEKDAPDFRNRTVRFDVMELTSRESNADVARAKRRLERPFNDREQRVDVAIATNMISVGLDITRLGLMVVLGQPKTTAEYIQASSRVGRDENRPGLVVTLLNVHKPRDRSHFERFEFFHQTFYRSVEATSVTPFSPRAVDRALVGVTVGLARQGERELTAPKNAVLMDSLRPRLSWVAEALAERARRSNHPDEVATMRERTMRVLDDWQRAAKEQAEAHAGLQYQREQGSDPALLHTPLDPALEQLGEPRNRFKASRSLRDVEPSVNLFVHVLSSEGDGPLLPED